MWHYTTALLDIRIIWTNFLVFFYNIFSIPTLLTTLFSPWMKIHDGYNINRSLLDTFVFNSLIRVFGVFVRLCFILIGTVALVLTFILGLLFYLVWFALPFILVVVFLWSLEQIK